MLLVSGDTSPVDCLTPARDVLCLAHFAEKNLQPERRRQPWDGGEDANVVMIPTFRCKTWHRGDSPSLSSTSAWETQMMVQTSFCPHGTQIPGHSSS